jgi:hypothetical protein
MSSKVLQRGLSGHIADLGVEQGVQGRRTTDGKIKAPPSARRMWLIGLGFSAIRATPLAGASRRTLNDFNIPSAIARVSRGGRHDDHSR